MSDKGSDDEDYFGNHNDSDGKSPVGRAGRDGDDDEGDPEIPPRNEDEDNDDKGAQEPEEGEDQDDAGYGGDEAYGGREASENNDEIGDQDAEEGDMEIQQTKDDEGGFDMYEDDDEENEYGEEKRSRNRKDKKKKDKRETSGKRKKIKKDEAEEDRRNEDDIDAVPRARGKKSKKEEEITNEEVIDFISEMHLAYKEDLLLFKNKKPALKKLQLLPKVEATLKRSAFQNKFLDLDLALPQNLPTGLEVFTKWLSKMPNGTLPSLQIRKKLVDILYHLPITEETLRNSEIGKFLYGMKNTSQDDPDLRRMVKDTVDKWTRLIITGTDGNEEPTEEDLRGRKKIDVSLDEYRQRSMSSLRKSIPRLTMKKSGFDFSTRPRSDGGNMRGTNKNQESSDACDKLIKDMKRKMKKDVR